MAKGTLLIDRQFGDLGRLQRRTGTTDPALRDEYDRMLTQLYKRPEHHPIIRSIQSGVLSFARVYEHFERHDLKTLIVVEQVIALDPHLINWVSQYSEIVPITRRNYTQAVKQFLRETNPTGTVSDLPDMMKKYRDVCLPRKLDRKYNMLRSVVQSYLANIFGRDHALYTIVTGRANLAALSTRRKRQPVVMHVQQAVTIAERLKSEKYRKMFWTMLTTGMLWSEYDGAQGWDVFTTHIAIHGTKREARERVVPLLTTDPTAELIAPATTVKYFRTRLHRASKGVTTDKVQIKDLRNTYNVWMVEAGIPKARREAYMGHAGYDLSDLYEAQDVKDFLLKDADTMRTYIANAKKTTLEQVTLAQTPVMKFKRVTPHVAKRGRKAQTKAA